MTAPGRNQPCPCGSGKKYKRCCLPSDETRVRNVHEAEVLPAEDAAEDETWADDDDLGPDELDVDLPRLEASDITRVTYTRGFVSRLSDFRRGVGVTVTDWSAPDIPQPVLECFEDESIELLGGFWGRPASGDPIQVDVIDIETAAEVLTVEVYNRAILLVHSDAEEIRQIHRLCGTLEAASKGETRLPVRTRKLPRKRPAAQGRCELCGQTIGRADVSDHLATCASAHDATTGPPARLIQCDVTAAGSRIYWLAIEAKADAKLEALDAMLRRTWLECCGHLSAFRIGDVDYFSRGYEVGGWSVPGLTRKRVERTMTARLGDALPPIGDRIVYEYDFGSTTMLQLTVTGERRGRIGRSAVRVLARNLAPVWTCSVCGEPATLICPYCLGDASALVCDAHRAQHPCEEGEAFLPVVNSPRMGVCGYTGDA